MEEVLFEILGDDHVAGFEQLQADHIGVYLAGLDAQPVAAEALRLQQAVDVLHQEWVVDRGAELNVAHVARTVHSGETAGRTHRLVIKR